jgi:predicted dehydrogenase
LELGGFLEAVATRREPLVTGEDGCRALAVALAVVDKIEEHSRLVAPSLASGK